MSLATTYTASSLADIADEFEARAREARDEVASCKTLQAKARKQATAQTWDLAASTLRRTTLVEEAAT